VIYCLLGEWILTELLTVILNVVELSQALVEFMQGDFTLSELSIESFWTVYMVVLYLSQAVADLYAGFFLILSELSIGWLESD